MAPRDPGLTNARAATVAPGSAPAANTSPPQPKSAGGKPNNPSDARRDWLARGLKQIYDKTLSDPIPETFRSLLEKLDRTDKPRS